MEGVIRYFVERPRMVGLLTFAVVVLGLLSLGAVRYESFPKVAIGAVNITTVHAGYGPEDIELSITSPIEDEVLEVAGVHRVSSASMEGLSVVTVRLDPDLDDEGSRETVARLREAVDRARGELPHRVARGSAGARAVLGRASDRRAARDGVVRQRGPERDNRREGPRRGPQGHRALGCRRRPRGRRGRARRHQGNARPRGSDCARPGPCRSPRHQRGRARGCVCPPQRSRHRRRDRGGARAQERRHRRSDARSRRRGGHGRAQRRDGGRPRARARRRRCAARLRGLAGRAAPRWTTVDRREHPRRAGRRRPRRRGVAAGLRRRAADPVARGDRARDRQRRLAVHYRSARDPRVQRRDRPRAATRGAGGRSFAGDWRSGSPWGCRCPVRSPSPRWRGSTCRSTS